MSYYGQTIQRVRVVNRQAALVMARQLPLLKIKGKLLNSRGPSTQQADVSLANAFLWGATPQGHVYWYEVAKQLGEQF